MSEDINDQLILIAGYSASGKSASLKNMRDQSQHAYLNCEAGKRLPFPNKFQNFRISDPYQVHEAFDHFTGDPDNKGIIVDSLTFLMDMYETQLVLNSANTMKAWGDFSQYFKTLMQQHVAKSTKNVIFTAHTADTLNEGEMVMETKVPVKGSLKNNGIESYFTIVIASKKVPLKTLKDSKSDLLTITPEEEALGFKYVFQTKLTKETVNERLRGPLGLFDTKETFIDNNAQLVINRLREYYN